MARNKYTYYASVAKKNGYEQIAALFLKTAENEKEHAKLWFRHLGGLGTVAENLQEQHVYVVQSAEGAGPLANHNSRKPIEETITYL